MTEEACGVRGCASTFAALSVHGQVILDDRARTFFAVCASHLAWLRSNCPASIDDGALIPASTVIRAGPARSTWLHDHCIPRLQLGTGPGTFDDQRAFADARAAERWPAA